MEGGAAAPDAVKVLLVGDSGVGKSHLMLRFTQESFAVGALPATVGVDYRTRSLLVGDRLLKLQIWDTAGLERFRAVTEAYFRGAAGVLVVYDVSNRRSFDALPTWLRSLESRSAKAARILVANKCDVSEDQRQVSAEEGRRFADEHRMLFCETSAVASTNVEQAFMALARAIIAKAPSVPTSPVSMPTAASAATASAAASRSRRQQTASIDLATHKATKGKRGCCD